MKRLLKAFGLVLGILAPAVAAPSGPPAGNFILNVSSKVATQIFSVSSGTVSGNLYVSTLTINNPSLFNKVAAYNSQGVLVSTTVTGGGGSGTPGGSSTQMQYNNAGSFGGTALETVDTSSVSFNTVSSFTYVGFSTMTFGAGTELDASLAPVLVKTLQVVGPGDGSIQLTVGGSTYTVTYTSVTISTGSPVVWTSTNGALGIGSGGGAGTPATPFNSVQYNNAGSFGGSSKFTFNGTSVTVVSSVTINSTGGGSLNTNPGLLDVFSQDSVADGIPLISAGSISSADQFWVKNNNAIYAKNGFNAGNLLVADVPNSFGDTIHSVNSVNNQINYWSGEGVTGEMLLQTSSQNIVMKPGTTQEVIVSTLGVITSSITTTGFMQLKSLTSNQILASTPTVVNGSATGEEYYCSDCSVIAVCVSTGTALGAYSLITNKTAQCK